MILGTFSEYTCTSVTCASAAGDLSFFITNKLCFMLLWFMHCLNFSVSPLLPF